MSVIVMKSVRIVGLSRSDNGRSCDTHASCGKFVIVSDIIEFERRISIDIHDDEVRLHDVHNCRKSILLKQ
jgi:hypothetical protein